MVTNYSAAVDAIYERFWNDWNTDDVRDLVGYIPQVEWAGKENRNGPDTSKFWVRISQQTVLESQISLGACVTDSTKRRYQSNGLVFVQMFCPKEVTDSIEIGRALATIARNAYRGKYAEGNIVFYRAKIVPLDPELEAYRFNVIAEYEYDEIG